MRVLRSQSTAGTRGAALGYSTKVHFGLATALGILFVGPALGVCADAPAQSKETESKTDDKDSSRYTTRSLQGRVVWLAEALARRHGVQSVPEAAESVLALETKAGQLIPLIEDKRGRSFRLDKRLRDVYVELLVRQYDGSPQVQVIQIFALKKDGKHELDYWCEICAIAMFELKPCDCCQADIELRARKVTKHAQSQ
jgi:hypothetical protein